MELLTYVDANISTPIVIGNLSTPLSPMQLIIIPIVRYFFYEDIVMKIGDDKYAEDVKEKQD